MKDEEGKRQLVKQDTSAVKEVGEGGKPKNPKSVLSFMKKILPKYFDSEWSFAQFRVPDIHTLCAFANENTLVGKSYVS